MSFSVNFGLSQQKLKIFVGQWPRKFLVIKVGKLFVYEQSKQNWQKNAGHVLVCKQRNKNTDAILLLCMLLVETYTGTSHTVLVFSH